MEVIEKFSKEWTPINVLSCKNFSCTNLSEKITNSLINTASTKIFSEPKLSLLEIITNSIDSYRQLDNLPTVGKFGMGFFSLFYWLITKPNSYIRITTNYYSMDPILKKESYICNVILKNGKLCFKLEKCQFNPRLFSDQFNKIFDKNVPHETGTKIELVLQGGGIEFKDVIKERYKFVDTCNIYLKNNNYELVNEKDDKSKNNIIIENGERYYSVTDHAQGISLAILLKKLFVPSSSNKNIISYSGFTSNFEVKPTIRYIKENKNLFQVVVGKIVILSIKHKKLPEQEKAIQVILSFPIDTPLPVSRDDIFINDITYDMVFNSILHTVYYSISFLKDTNVIFSILESYYVYNQQDNLRKIIFEIKNVINEDKRLYFIPKYNKEINFIKELLNTTLVSFENNNYLRTEDMIINNLSKNPNCKIIKNLFKNKIVILLKQAPFKNYQDFGLSGILFINEENFNERDISNVILTYTKERLIPFDRELTSSKIYERQIKKYGLTIYEKELFSLAMSVLALSDSVKLKSESFLYKNLKPFEYLLMSIKLFQSLFSQEIVKKMIYSYQYYFTTFDLKYSYKFSLFIIYNLNNLYNQSNYVKITKQIVPEYNFEHYLIQGVQFYLSLSKISEHFFSFDEEALIDLSYFEEHKLIYNYIINNIKEYYVVKIFVSCLRQNDYPITEDLLDFLLAEISQRFTQKTILDIYFSHMLLQIISNEKIYTPLNNSLKIFIKTKENILKSSKDDSIKFTKNYSFSAKNLLNYIYENNVEEDINFNNFFEKIENFKAFKDFNDLQILEIAVNEGTTREFTKAVLIELTQNSIDALKNKVRKNIQLNVEENNIIFYDNAGIEDSAILSLLVPFLSSKTGKEILYSGQIGTGFFNVYRQPYTKEVRIKTTNKNSNIDIVVKPVVKDGRVIDLIYNLFWRKRITVGERSKSGTEIKIILNPNNISILVDSLLFKNYVLSLIETSLYDNDVKVNAKRKTIYENNKFSAYSVDEYYPSYVFTKGVPFDNLYNYLLTNNIVSESIIRYCSNGLVIDISNGIFIPTQSRNKILIEDGQKDFLLTSIKNAIYIYIATKIVNDKKEQKLQNLISLMIPYYYNTNYYKSLLPNPYSENKNKDNISDFMYYYNGFGKSLATVIISIANKISDLGDDFKIGEYKDIGTHPLILKIAKNWIKKKKKVSDNFGTIVNIEQKSEDVFFKKFCYLFVKYYCILGLKLEKSGYFIGTNFAALDDIKLFFKSSMSNNLKGYYTKKDKSISLNNSYIGIKLREELKTLVTKNKIDFSVNFWQKTECKKFFAPVIPAPVIIHELCHAWSKDNDHFGGHGNMTLVIDGIKKDYTFDQAAVTVYKEIINAGLFDYILMSKF